MVRAAAASGDGNGLVRPLPAEGLTFGLVGPSIAGPGADDAIAWPTNRKDDAMLSWLIRGLTALLATFGAAAAAAVPGTVEGTVHYDSNAVAMTHVVARETRPSGTEPPQTVILITDRAAPAEIAGSRQAYYAAAREGRIRGLLIVIERPAEPPRLVIFAPGGGTDQTVLPDIFDRIELADFVRADGFVSGRLRSTEPREFNFGDDPNAPQTYALDLRFRVPVTPAPRPTETLTGDAARRSPQAAAALRALQLIHSGSLAEIRAQLMPDHPMWEALGSGSAENVLRIARENLPRPATYLQTVQRVVVFGDEAVVHARDAEGDIDVSLRRADGEWKMARSPISND